MDNSKEKYEICKKITEDALSKLESDNSELANTYLDFIHRYVSDAEYYAKKNMYATALEAIAYAHGFIDAGVIAGVFKIPGYHLEDINS